jgi:uncharacterized OsmC-like protein
MRRKFEASSSNGRAIMAAQDIATAWRRVESVLRRRPEFGLQDDAAASAHWDGGTRATCSHANGHSVQTDMPVELGGTGDQVSPGWLLRAGLASCAVTGIAMLAATRGIALTALEVVASSRSDARGFMGISDSDGMAIDPGPQDVRLLVRIASRQATPEVLRALVHESQRHSPVTCALQNAVRVALQIDIASA